ARAAILGAGSADELEHARVAYLGRRSALSEALRNARALAVEERAELNRTKLQLEELVRDKSEDLRRAELERAVADEVVDVTLPGARSPRGHRHPISQLRREVASDFLGLRLAVFTGLDGDLTRYIL